MKFRTQISGDLGGSMESKLKNIGIVILIFCSLYGFVPFTIL